MSQPIEHSLEPELAYIRVLLQGGGPADAESQHAFARRAVAHIRNKEKVSILADQLAVALGFHHLLAGMNDSAVGPCHEALDILDEIEVASAHA